MFHLNFDFDFLFSGLDTLALTKRNESKLDGAFKVPRERITSVAASLDEEEKSTVTDIDEDEVVVHKSDKRRPNWRFREASLSEASQSGYDYPFLVSSSFALFLTPMITLAC